MASTGPRQALCKKGLPKRLPRVAPEKKTPRGIPGGGVFFQVCHNLVITWGCPWGLIRGAPGGACFASFFAWFWIFWCDISFSPMLHPRWPLGGIHEVVSGPAIALFRLPPGAPRGAVPGVAHRYSGPLRGTLDHIKSGRKNASLKSKGGGHPKPNFSPFLKP